MKANFLRSLYRDYIASIRFRIKFIFSYITEKFCDIRNTDIGYFELFSIFSFILRRSCFQKIFKICVPKFCNIHRKTPVKESLFDKVAGLKVCNFIKKRLKHSCFPVNIEKVFWIFYRKPW